MFEEEKVVTNKLSIWNKKAAHAGSSNKAKFPVLMSLPVVWYMRLITETLLLAFTPSVRIWNVGQLVSFLWVIQIIGRSLVNCHSFQIQHENGKKEDQDQCALEMKWTKEILILQKTSAWNVVWQGTTLGHVVAISIIISCTLLMYMFFKLLKCQHLS